VTDFSKALRVTEPPAVHLIPSATSKATAFREQLFFCRFSEASVSRDIIYLFAPHDLQGNSHPPPDLRFGFAHLRFFC